MGVEDRAPTPEELEQMRRLVAKGMEEGAVGLSTGLVYPPSAYAATAEIVELAKVAAKYGGSYHTHMRNEGERIWEPTVQRFLRANGVPFNRYDPSAPTLVNGPAPATASASSRPSSATGR